MEMKLTKKLVKYTNKEGVEKSTYNFFIKVDNNTIAIKPAFANNYQILKFLAEEDN